MIVLAFGVFGSKRIPTISIALTVLVCLILGVGASPVRASTGFRGRVDRVLDTAAARTFQARFEALVASDGAVELADVLRSDQSSPSSFDKAALAVPGLLRRFSARNTVRVLEAGRRPSRMELRDLAKTVRALDRNLAIRALARRGRDLKSDPKRLHRLVGMLTKELHALAMTKAAPAPPRDPFTATALALSSKAGVHGADSLADAVADLLSAPGATTYLANLPPVALGALDPSLPRSGTAGASAAGGNSGLTCSAAEFSALEATARGASEGAMQMMKEHANSKAVLKLVKGFIPDWTRAAGVLEGNPISSILQTVLWDAAKNGYPAVRSAAIDCYATRIELLPAQKTITAGSWQAYKIAIYDADGQQVFGSWINDPDGMSISARSVPPDSRCVRTIQWECDAKTAGTYSVFAALRKLRTTGVLGVEPGPPVSLAVVPESATVGVGEKTPRYEAAGQDAFQNPTEPIIPGEATKDGVRSHLRMSPEGSCSDATATCVAGVPGPHDVIIERGDGVQNHARLEVLPNKLRLSPATATISRGSSEAYTGEEVSALGGKDFGPVAFGDGPGQAHLSISPDGTCDQASATCTPLAAGPHTVTAVSTIGDAEALLVVEGDQAALCAEGAGASPLPTPSAGWTNPEDISTTSGFNPGHEPQLAMNASGEAVVLWSSPLGIVAATKSASTGWASFLADPAVTARREPRVSINAAGDWAGVWTYASRYDEDTFEGIRGAQCEDARFAQPETIQPPAFSTDPAAAIDRYEPVVGIDGTGHATAAWRAQSKLLGGEEPGVTAVESSDSDTGGAWSAAGRRSGSEEQNYFGPAIGEDENGGASVVWSGLSACESLGAVRAVDRSGGGWSSVKDIFEADPCWYGEPEIEKPVVAMGPDGEAVALWTWYNRSLSPGHQELGWNDIQAEMRSPTGQWSAAEELPESNGASVMSAAVGRTGEAIVLSVNLQTSQMTATTRTGMSAWKVPVPLGSVSGWIGGGSVAINDAGDAVAVWISGTGVWASYRLADSAWEPARLVSGSAAGATWPQVGIDDQGSALAVWEGPSGAVQFAELRP